MALALELLANILIPGVLFAVIAAGFSLIYAVTRVLHVAHGAVVLIGGYAFWWAWSARELPAPVAALVAVAIATAAGLFMNAIYERLRGRTSISAAGMLITTLSLLLIAQNVLLAIFGAATRSLADLQGATRAFGPVIVTAHELRLLVWCPLLLLALALWLWRSRTGTALRAVADQEHVAEIVGISARRMRALAFGIGSGLAGAAGATFAIQYGLEPGMATGLALRMFFRAVVGGIGSVGGALGGSLVAETGMALTAWFWNTAWVDLTTFVLTFIVLLIRPQGLFARRRRSV